MEKSLSTLPFRAERMISVKTAIFGGVIVLLAGLLLGGLISGRGIAAQVSGPPEGVDFSPVWKAWNVIDEKFVPAAVASTTKVASTTEERNKERVWGMVSGLAESLGDPYTFFLPPKENEIFSEDISGAFEGVGMEVAVRDQVLTVVSPLKGNPAERAGIKSGDRILKIDDLETRGMDISTAVSHIRGKKGTAVRLFVMREGFSEPREFKVTREVITVPIVDTKTRPDGIFVITLHSFTASSPELFRGALRQFIESGDRDLILDLRGNPGGYLEAAVAMASWFLPQGRVVVTEDYGGDSDSIVHRSRGYDIFNENLRMVILVDRGSASASEILAGALQSHGVATLVGDKTFGKGSVQELVEITRDTALKITVARWLAPDGKPIPIDGIAPDVAIKNSDEDQKAGKDPQLEKAVQTVKAK